MKIAVLGATGLLGHHTARAVKAAGHELVLIHRLSSRIERLAYLGAECRAAELLDQRALSRALHGVDGVIFCAGHYPRRPRRWQDEVASALDQTQHFYAACQAVGVGRIVYVGSAIALPRHPQGLPGHEGLFYEGMPRWRNPYVLSKWALDEQAREQARAGLPVMIGIPGLSLGELDAGPSSGRLITAIDSGEMRGYVPGQRNLVDAREAGRGLLLTLERGRVGERYLITGENIQMADLTARIAERLGVPMPVELSLSKANGLAAWGRLRYRLTGAWPWLDETAIALMSGSQFLDGRKAREELGFVARQSVDDTLQHTIQWFADNGYLRQRAG
ncbi:NAD-dependent epimerase/dehydratase family protein [Phytopseudomonas dryadis]|uniref:Epimerase n=1 Tax=Phytopseudomonas dryadis TaxID=2487520 RepID=A0A4Q9QZ42_9GAMM|nr:MULTISPECIES: NAD-dependent epimerase/dehydratase family protein [Pseudomonas]TBU89718.1 epimerase [Pseudomonas dryadis]TBV06011.1 epimerase [Pseudomonas dryadis]TBV18152.1 epimerase [Pseudomonas sp. FRB 230]